MCYNKSARKYAKNEEKACTSEDVMYRFEERQISFTDFNQSQGLQMNPENRWIKKAEMIPWDTIVFSIGTLPFSIVKFDKKIGLLNILNYA